MSAYLEGCVALGDDCSVASATAHFTGWSIGFSFVFGSDTFVRIADGIAIEGRWDSAFVEWQDAGTDNVIVRLGDGVQTTFTADQQWDLNGFDRVAGGDVFGDPMGNGGGSFYEPQFVFSLQMDM